MSTNDKIKSKIIRILPNWLLNIKQEYILKKRFKEWVKNNSFIPPPHYIKQLVIINYQKKTKYNTLIETGTFRGDMVAANIERFKKIISIELSDELFINVKRRFSKNPNVILHQGDSGNILADILKGINEPAIFWLDGHYSAGITALGEKQCPILEELDSILKQKKLNHLILIDDARLFVGKDDYPTISEIKNFIRSKNRIFNLQVSIDIIRIQLE